MLGLATRPLGWPKTRDLFMRQRGSASVIAAGNWWLVAPRWALAGTLDQGCW